MTGRGRDVLKCLGEGLALGTGLAHVARRRHAGRTLILAWHNILPPGSAPGLDASLHLPQARFGAQLDALLRTHEVIALDDLDTPGGARPRVVLTFDDAYRGALSAGREELARRGLRATVFVAPGLLGRATPWWDRLRDGAGRPLVETARDRALGELAGDDGAISRWALAAGGTEEPGESACGIVTEAELADALAGGVFLAESHSWSHPNLAAIPPGRLAEELRRPREWLERHSGRRATWLAYPYGRYSAAVEVAAREAGYRGGLAIDGGWVAGEGYTRPRYNVPAGLSARGFELRSAGVTRR